MRIGGLKMKQKDKRNKNGLASVAISTGIEEETSFTLLLQCFAPGSTREL